MSHCPSSVYNSEKRDADNTSQKNGNMSGTHKRSENFPVVRNQTRLSVIKELQEQTSGVEISAPAPSSFHKVSYAKTRDASNHQMMPEQNAKVYGHSIGRQNTETKENDSENVSLATKRATTRASARLKAAARFKVPMSPPSRNLKSKSLSRDKEAKQCKSTKQCVVVTGDEKSTPAKEVDANIGQIGKPATASSQAKTHSVQNARNETLLEHPVATRIRSLAGSKVPTAPPSRNFNHKSLSRDKEAKQCNSISSSAQKPVSSKSCAVSRGCLATEHTDGAKKSRKTKPGDLLLPLTGLKNIQPVVTSDEKSTPAKELPLPSVTLPSHGFDRLNFSPPHGSPLKAGPAMVEDKCLTMSSSATKNDNNSDSLDGTATPNDSLVEEKNADDRVSTPCKRETDSTEEGSSMKRAYTFFGNQRQCSQEIDYDDSSPVFTIPEDGGKPDIFTSEESAENRLQRLLAFEDSLREIDVRAKISIQEVVSSTSEKIRSLIRAIEFRIQADVRELISREALAKKLLEIRLQEQQKYLKSVHNEYMEGLHMYLKTCRCVMEEHETQQFKLDEAIDSQNLKLVSQAREAIENRAIVASDQIMSICEIRRKKIQQLSTPN